MTFHIKSGLEEIGTIVILHGYGADAEDLKFMAQEWQKFFSKWNFVGIDGRIKLESGFAWFNPTSKDWAADIADSAAYIEKQFSDYKKKLIFVGFSQGAFMCAHLGLFSRLKIDGCICFSGGIIPINQRANDTPIYLIHGSADEVILPEWFEQGLMYADSNNLPISGIMIEKMAHEINEHAFGLATMKLKEMINSEAKMLN